MTTSCTWCLNDAVVRRLVCSNDPYDQYACPKHRDMDTRDLSFDTRLYNCLDWQPIEEVPTPVVADPPRVLSSWERIQRGVL